MFRHSIQRGRDDGGLLTGCGINIYADGSATARDLTEAIFNGELESCRDCDRLFAKALGFSQEVFQTQTPEKW